MEFAYLEALLQKGAVEEVAPSPGHYSRMFLILKKDGGWHPIFNLKRLNKTLVLPSFLMDTARDVPSLLCLGDYRGYLGF